MFKLPDIPISIFSKMSHLAKEHGAINLSQGFPDFGVDPILIALVEEVSKGGVHQYSPMAGEPKLLEETAKLVYESYGRTLNPKKEILITAGATQGVFTCIQALIEPGDEVLILDPSYDCYVMPITLSQGIPVRIPLNETFLPDWDLIKGAVNDKTKLIITNNPHNPSGRIWSKADMQELSNLLETNNNLYHLSDEVYEHITFDARHESANLYEALRAKTIIVSSFGKSFHITGWKVGYIVAPENLMNELKKVHQYLVFTVNSLSQHVLSEYLKKQNVKQLGAFYKQKRDLFRTGMKNSKFELLPCEGTYFQLASYAKHTQASDVDFCHKLVEEFKLAAIPVSVFSARKESRKVIRFCFAKENETLTKATELLCQI
ncbi:MAG: aminotransferase class I/II-fold pyridoxal phosphate-dependent enzyme [Crocinitomicaceae bacterium]|nr:aminotransferase class I/II-fold pyridoxal phosphate-dependent enzyme [Crocinitomicaceae bacterium]